MTLSPVCDRLIDDLEHRVLSSRWDECFYSYPKLRAKDVQTNYVLFSMTYKDNVS